MQLHFEDGRYRLRFVVRPESQDDPLPAIEFGMLGRQVARQVLGGRATDVTLADAALRDVKAVPPSEYWSNGESVLFFTGARRRVAGARRWR